MGIAVPRLTSQDILRILIASPGDLREERQAIRHLAEEINHIWSDYFSLRLRVIMWEDDTFPAIGSDPQAVVNTQVGDDYEVFLGMFGERLGQPTPRAASGTIEEFDRAYERYRLTRQPQIMFYFRNAATVPQEVENFRQRIGDLGVYYATFQDMREFTARARFGLSRLIQHVETRRASSRQALIAAPDAPIASASAAFDAATTNMVKVRALAGEMAEEMRSVNSHVQRAAQDLKALSRPGLRKPKGGLSSVQARLAARFDLNADRMGSRSRLVASAHDAALEDLSRAILTLVPAPELRSFLLSQLGPTCRNLDDLAGSIEQAQSGLGAYREAMKDHPSDSDGLRKARERVRSVFDFLHRDLEGMVRTTRSIAASLRQQETHLREYP